MSTWYGLEWLCHIETFIRDYATLWYYLGVMSILMFLNGCFTLWLSNWLTCGKLWCYSKVKLHWDWLILVGHGWLWLIVFDYGWLWLTMCDIPLWRTENTYYLRTLARKWSGPFLMLDLFIGLWCDWKRTWCVTIWCRRVLLTQFCWVCRVFDLEDAEASVEPPWTLDWVRECDFWLICLLWCFIWFDVLMSTFLTWLLVMQADNSLPTWLTYGVKGPHTIAERLRERGGQQPCHCLLALSPWLEL